METFLKACKEIDPVGAIGSFAGIVAIVVAILVVGVTVRRTLRVATLVSLRDELQTILDNIEISLRAVPDEGPYTREMVQGLSDAYWNAKHRFELICEKAVIIIPPKHIRHSLEAVPRLQEEYNEFVNATRQGQIASKPLNNFKAVLVGTLLVTEKIIAREFLSRCNRTLANQLIRNRQKRINDIQDT